MKTPGIAWMLQTGLGLSMAGPFFLLGAEFLVTGRLVPGGGLVAMGLIALFLPTYIVRNIGGPGTWLRNRLGRADRSDD